MLSTFHILTFLGRVASKNANKTLSDIFNLATEEMKAVSVQDWEGAVRLARKQEKLYKELDNPLEPNRYNYNQLWHGV